MKTKRTIEEILDLETGRNINAGKLFEEDRGFIFNFREQLEIDIRKGNKRYVCLSCKQNLNMRGTRLSSKVIMHFLVIYVIVMYVNLKQTTSFLKRKLKE